jgi:hypothetical protein
MLYFGVGFIRSGFKVTVLSQGFATVDQKLFYVGQDELFRQWVADIKTSHEEPAMWFFDEKDFHNPEYNSEVFYFANEYDSLFLVNHRALCNIRQFGRELFALCNVYNSDIETEFVLASAMRIFHQQDLKPFNPDLFPVLVA